ncbi:O-antigen ligase family protein [Acaryochloris sp. IP29b_bin.148]|uniref:O-antigen ligase family protein n=1 Tax=Acaryochloris sp. IP29b_bin.148 TaxID=2969218 RepID=UPI00261B9094|nr:O-antigen ligase family protein [Acaryochloris sp. IP29b_bin.148]
MAISSTSEFDDPDQPIRRPTAKGGSLLACLCMGLYALFTLIPDSHSLMVVWPWVLIWQVTWVCPLLWLAGQLWYTQHFPRLKQGLDWIVAIAVIGLVLSTLFAPFPNQARWYAWPALGGLAAIYAICAWCQTPERRQRLLVMQGLLSSGFILLSLTLWITQTLLPELSRLRALQQAGVQASYNFSTLELRNWAPFGHQNYVAGYLVLALPLLLGLCMTQAGRWRWGWAISLGLGLLDLYTTSSRGGWIGCVVCGLYLGVALSRYRGINRRWLLGGSVASFGMLMALVLANNRLSSQVSNLIQGRSGGDMAYRIITHQAGWAMGLQNPWTGMGPGSVPLAYQAYRPTWAGLEAEHAYQLHGTVAQIWAELGLAGMVPVCLLLGWLIYQGWRCTGSSTALAAQDRLQMQSLLAGLLGYSVVCLTDYQLDNVGISGFLVISLGVLAATCRSQHESQALSPPSNSDAQTVKKRGRWWAGTLLGVVLATSLWLVPIHWGWAASSQGFAALGQQQLDQFRQYLDKAQTKVPWEPYYAYQLGWNLGDLGLKSQDPKLRQTLLPMATQHFIQGNQLSPDQEFGHTNLAWLYMQRDPKKATAEFVRSAELVPAKRGVFFGLGLSLLAQGQPDLAMEAMTLECLRNPLWITSPAWRSQPLQPLYAQLLTRLEQAHNQLMQTHSDDLKTYLHRASGSLQWWRGNLDAAQADLDPYGSALSRTLLTAFKTPSGTPFDVPQELPMAARSMLQAWLTPDRREALVTQAWLVGTNTPPSAELVQTTLKGMTQAQTFQQWLQDYPIVRKYHRQRAGFGVLSRHTDGPNPTDFFLIIDNGVMSEIFAEMMPTPIYLPALDRALQDRRNALLAEVKALSGNAMLTSSLIQGGVMD